MNKLLSICVLAGVVLLCMPDSSSVTETDTGTINGWVVNADNNGVDGATVILRDTSGFADTMISGNGGSFSFTEVGTGSYYLEIITDDSLGALVETSLSPTNLEQEIGKIIVKRLGTVKGSIDYSLTGTSSTYIYIIALDRKVPVDSLGFFLIENVPENDYSVVLIEGTITKPSVLDSVVISVENPDTTTVLNLGSTTGAVTIHGTVTE